jgi:hemolysin activation/secretion protein
LNNITQRGDTLLANLLKSDGLDYVGVGYELPFTTRGWRFESRAAYSQYRLVDPVFSSADMKGPTRNLGVGIVIPLARNSRHSINLQTTIDTNRYENSALSNVLSRYRTTLLGAQIDGQHIDSDGRGQTQWAAQITRGELDLSDSPASYRTQDSAGPRTEGFFNKARMSFTRRNWIDPHNTVTATAQAQWASKNLDGSEKFYLGGPRGVRAYPVNEGGGSLGHLASLEWESMMLQNAFGRVSVAGFYDHGRVRLYEDSSNITSLNRNEYVLHGYGLWIGTQAKLTGGSLGLRLTIARRIGDNPGTTTGLDSDGTRVLNRVRLDANLAF